MPTNIAPFYAGWQLMNDTLVEAFAPLSDEQMRIEIRLGIPVWASAAHMAGTRVFWFCRIFGEPGMETTPFQTDEGWEDDLTHPRSASEIVGALTSTWKIIDHVLQTWTPESLVQTARRVTPSGKVQIHTRQSVLWRGITHEAFHIGEISSALGENGITGGPNGPVDLWAGLSRPG